MEKILLQMHSFGGLSFFSKQIHNIFFLLGNYSIKQGNKSLI